MKHQLKQPKVTTQTPSKSVSRGIAAAALIICAACSTNAQNLAPDRGAIRHLRSAYDPGVTVAVTISVNLSSRFVWAVEDGIPPGWAVANISTEGSFDSLNRKVKWLFFDGPQSCGPTNPR